ncbi:DUF3667 domain-containing protein [Mucilaginibacter sp. UR6-11]|uniref:DUF3667 domain-containing protein n=1 Tax=Mucilaginibacter sp. UR6-11 TaxID=1435644 RepID=UPI001E495F44|nr:DUF3667 domain-containing protein [Mucilaginibacter sp. UR6-11]MCC8426991.1 DUF3667 domain-containing protein [Mucilaginibacter sp. UR6-11]
MKKHYRHENDCANCGTELQGKFCHACGQENLELRENFGHMMNHAISDYFHFDHQFFHTLRPLLFKPGKLTNEYMAGKRVQYLHPVKMYIFISLVYFLLLFKSGFEPVKINETHNGKPTKKELAKNAKELDKVLNDPNVPGVAKKMIAKEKAKLDTSGKGDIKNTDKDEDIDVDELGVNGKITRLPGASRDSSYSVYLAKQQKLPAAERDGFFERLYNKKAFYYQEKYGERAKDVYVEEIKHNIPKMMFLLLPLCALIFRVAFWRNKKFYVEHLIFTFHLHCFMFLYLAIIMILQMVIPKPWGLEGWLSFAAFIGITWYIYRALRVFYNRSRWRTISKMLGASFMYLLMFTICITIVSILTALAI